MKNFKNPFFLFLALLLTVGIVSCSSDDDTPPGPIKPAGSDIGSGTFTMSGDEQGVRSGMAYFELITIEGLGSKIWTIDIYDHSPQTFSLGFSCTTLANDPSQPGIGTYPIGIDLDNPTAIFFNADLSLIENENYADAVDYSSSIYVAGAVTITTSTDKKISGTFEFAADSFDDLMNVTGSIVVSGSFSAVP